MKGTRRWEHYNTSKTREVIRPKTARKRKKGGEGVRVDNLGVFGENRMTVVITRRRY